VEEYLQNKTILLVDDTPENIDVLNGMLGDFKRKIATNGERALKIASSSPPPDLILLDIMMPGMDGYEVATRLRANESTKDIPIIFLTAKTAKEDIVKGFEAGGQDYVTKPFDPNELMERVKTQLKLRHQQKLLESMNEVLEQKVRERTAQLEESNQKLEEAFEKLKVLDEAKSNFLKLISHEIRTPLNGIVGSTYFLEDMVQDEDLKEFIGILKESVERLERFAINALFLTQLDTLKNDVSPTPVNLEKAIEKAREENKKQADKKGIAIRYDKMPVSPVLGDEKLVVKSLSETLNNAIKFSTEKEIHLRTWEEDGWVKVQIINEGEEIPEEKLKNITEAFGLADQHMDKNSGLGLAIVNACQKLIQGKLEIESKEGKITVTLAFRKTD
jgi:two-component system sensor histidine kinase/response regulator